MAIQATLFARNRLSAFIRIVCEGARLSTKERLRIEIHGAVQGVGFRPFVYRLATELLLAGWVVNDPRGVFIEIEGNPLSLSHFVERLPQEKPPRAILHSVSSSSVPVVGEEHFEIRASDEHGRKTALVLPDVATCADCRRELFDPLDRRFGYPFTNCTNCGPRFTILHDLPYDRPSTTMRGFTMCRRCQAEYDDPRDRRFHAQPNACPVCGPHLELWTAAGSLVTSGDDVFSRAATYLKDGLIVAVKGLGGFHLMVDAANAASVTRLRESKPRRDKPFALMARDLEQARLLCEVPPLAEALLASAEAPIVLLRRRSGAPVADNVAPGNPNLAIMLPYTPLHALLLAAMDRPVVATSGNLSDEPICTDEREAVDRLGSIADLFLVHNRPIERHVDDSVAWVVREEVRLLRRARGYAPLPVLVTRPLPAILAVGAHLKNTIALSVDRQVFISQHIGDLETPQALAAFDRVISDFLRLYEASPIAIAHDLHPDYLSTHWAQQASASMPGLPFSSAPQLIPVQHHHAHLAACLAENAISGRALGIAWDGTGHGGDGTVWGGEFLLGDTARFQRVGHFRPFRLLGGEAAIKEPSRLGLAVLWALFGERGLERTDLPPVLALGTNELSLFGQMLRRGVNSPLTTSAGRLFDAIAALIGLRQRVTFEGQAAMELEYLADSSVSTAYPFDLNASGASFVLDWQPTIEALLEDFARRVPSSTIAARFHNALVEAIIAAARLVGERRVALTGGCFQNRWLTERAAAALSAAGHEVLLHRLVPANDGGISLGQVAVAAARLEGAQ